MTSDTTGTARANRDGHPCPPWCIADHDQLIIDGAAEYGYMDVHQSDPVMAGEPAVRLVLYPGENVAPVIDMEVRRKSFGRQNITVALNLTIEQASRMAEVSRAIYGDEDLVAVMLTAAAAVARDTK
jgi:hypothetical protein